MPDDFDAMRARFDQRAQQHAEFRRAAWRHIKQHAPEVADDLSAFGRVFGKFTIDLDAVVIDGKPLPKG